MVYNIDNIENIYLSLTFSFGKTIYIHTPRRHTLSSIYIYKLGVFIRSINFNFYPNTINLKNENLLNPFKDNGREKYNLRKSQHKFNIHQFSKQCFSYQMTYNLYLNEIRISQEKYGCEF